MCERALQEEAFAKRVGENLLRARQAAGLSQDDLYMAGMHRTEVSKIERGSCVPRSYTLWRLAECLEADYGELLAGLRWRAPQPQRGSLEVEPA
jgi:transcriptional regulator with XRE-family HTH domain